MVYWICFASNMVRLFSSIFISRNGHVVFFSLASLSDIGIRWILSSYNVFGSDSSLLFFWDWIGLMLIDLFMFGRIQQWGLLVLDFSLLGDFWLLIQCLYYKLLRLSILCEVSFGNLCVSRNLSICIDYLIWKHTVHIILYNPFNFCKINSNVLAFVSDFNSSVFSPFSQPS